jgi:hypothetical protein
MKDLDRSRPEYVDAVWKLLQFSPPIGSKISRIKMQLLLIVKKEDKKFDKVKKLS